MKRAPNANLAQRGYRHNQLIAETLAELRAAGFAATVERGRRHFQIKFGRQGLLIISATPSKILCAR
jgi:hypothetical protein